jgi:hypothetical protein
MKTFSVLLSFMLLLAANALASRLRRAGALPERHLGSTSVAHSQTPVSPIANSLNDATNKINL